VVGRGRSDYRTEAVRACLQDAGLSVTPLQEWIVDAPEAVMALGPCTLYTTLEPSTRRRGTALPPITHLIRAAAPMVRRVVLGCPSPVPEKAYCGAQFLHQAGLEVRLMQAGTPMRTACQALITDFTASANGKLQRMARKHFQLFGRPLGFLHCSVIHSDNVEAFRRHGNAFGTTFGPSTLSYRNFGAYELAPPPDVIWATEEDERSLDIPSMETDDDDDGDDDDADFVTVNFEDYPETTTPRVSPMMPWYDQVDAVVATFPRSGNGPPNDDSVRARLAGLVWLATYGQELPAGVERILVLDATELPDLPLTNDDPNLPPDVDIEAFWTGRDRKATRVLLRRGVHEAARAAAQAASRAAHSAAAAAQSARQALESGQAADYAAAAQECARTATAAQVYLQEELERTQVLRVKLESLGVVVENLEGGEPVDVMQHLGERNGLYSVVWRAGCWGDRGVRAILAGAFQWVSAHLAVPADGGRFWQLMMAENAVQAACGPQSKVKVFADQDDISMEYCDNVGDDEDCVLSVEGKPIRHVRLDCRVALVDAERPREFDIAKTQKISRKVLVEQAPWFL
jgi:pyrimidine deaminase RibD-like protein